MGLFKKKIFMCLALAVSLAGACKSTSFKGSNGKKAPASIDGGASESFKGANSLGYQVDVIFLLDSSDSMASKIKKTNENLDFLVKDYLNKVQGLDYQLIIVGKRIPSITGPKVGLIKEYVGSNSALANAQAAIEGKYKVEKTDAIGPDLEIRANASKELVVVSDDDSDVSAEKFLEWMDANPNIAGSVYVNGIIANTLKCGGIFGFGGAIGKVYMELANTPRTRGVIGNLCLFKDPAAWNQVFSSLGEQLTQFKKAPVIVIQLKSIPPDPSKISVKINGQTIDPSKIKYDASNNSLTISHETGAEDQIDVSY